MADLLLDLSGVVASFKSPRDVRSASVMRRDPVWQAPITGAVSRIKVLGCDLEWGSVKVETIEELHCELPPGVDLLPGHGPIDADALRAIEEE